MLNPFGGSPGIIDMIAAVLLFSAFTTLFVFPIWSGIRRMRKRRVQGLYAFIGIVALCLTVSGIDVTRDGTSGIFSILSFIAIPAYMAAIALMALIVAACFP